MTEAIYFLSDVLDHIKTPRIILEENAGGTGYYMLYMPDPLEDHKSGKSLQLHPTEVTEYDLECVINKYRNIPLEDCPLYLDAFNNKGTFLDRILCFTICKYKLVVGK